MTRADIHETIHSNMAVQSWIVSFSDTRFIIMNIRGTLNNDLRRTIHICVKRCRNNSPTSLVYNADTSYSVNFRYFFLFITHCLIQLALIDSLY